MAEDAAEGEPIPVQQAPPAAPRAKIGIPACDAYLVRYRQCEPVLSAEIQAGERRPYRAEHGWLEYLSKSAEAPALPSSCAQLLEELATRCPE